jgi:hypothetical protein
MGHPYEPEAWNDANTHPSRLAIASAVSVQHIEQVLGRADLFSTLNFFPSNSELMPVRSLLTNKMLK